MYRTVKTFSTLKKILEKVDVDTLIIFDVDDVLVVAQDALFHPSNRNASLKEECFKKMYRHFPLNQGRRSGFFQLLSSVFLNGKRGLVHSGMPRLIVELQERKINTLGLTNSEVGRFGKIERFEDWKILELKSWNIHLGEFFCEKVSSIALDAPSSFNSLFKEGIIFTDNSSKGQCLMNFFDKIDFIPKLIIFIDDLEKNLDDVRNACSKRLIPFLGIHFLQAHLQKCELNLQRASKQLEYLFSENEWIKDEKIL